MANDLDNYSKVAKFFHWVIAVMIFFNLASGVVLVYFDKFSQQIELFGIHKQFGVMILLLALLRLIWRLTHKYPSLKGLLPAYELTLAYFGHTLLYMLMFAVPISGVLFSQSYGKEIYFLWFKLPELIAPTSKGAAFQFLSLHKYLAIIIASIVCGHILAALKHHFVDKNRVLLRMLPSWHK